MAQKSTPKIPPRSSAQNVPELLRISGRSKPLTRLLAEATAAGMPIAAPPETLQGEIEENSAIDLSLDTETVIVPPPAPLSGTSYAGLTPAQRYSFLAWCHNPVAAAPLAYQQLYLANLEARLLEEPFRQQAIQQMEHLGTTTPWATLSALHRAYLLACWLLHDEQRLATWIGTRPVPVELLGIALSLQAMLGASLTAQELGTIITTWQLGPQLEADLLKLRLDSLTAILGEPPLAYALAKVDVNDTTPRPWRTSHRGLRLLIPQPDLRPFLEPSLRDLLSVADFDEEPSAPAGIFAAADSNRPAEQADESSEPSLEELGWRLILEFGSNRSEYFDYVLIQCQKMPSYSQLMDEDRRIVYRTIFRKSEMRRFWRIWDYVHGWTSTRVYLNGEELEKWKVWPYSQHLR